VATKHELEIQQRHAPERWSCSLRVRGPHFASKVSYNAGAATDDCVGQRELLSRCSKLVYSIHAGKKLSDIALPHSFAPTTAFHQSRSPLRSFFKTAVGTK